VNADLSVTTVHAELLPGRPAHLVAFAPHSSGWSAGSASCSECQTRSKLNIRTFIICSFRIRIPNSDPNPLTRLNPDPIGIRIRNPAKNSISVWKKVGSVCRIHVSNCNRDRHRGNNCRNLIYFQMNLFQVPTVANFKFVGSYRRGRRVGRRQSCGSVTIYYGSGFDF
jgi:hypothetical protein